jgi:hypothetical protein
MNRLPQHPETKVSELPSTESVVNRAEINSSAVYSQWSYVRGNWISDALSQAAATTTPRQQSNSACTGSDYVLSWIAQRAVMALD